MSRTTIGNTIFGAVVGAVVAQIADLTFWPAVAAIGVIVLARFVADAVERKA